MGLKIILGIMRLFILGLPYKMNNIQLVYTSHNDVSPTT